MRKRIIATLIAGVSAGILLFTTATPAQAVLVWIYNPGSSARGTIDKVTLNVAADDIKADGKSAVTRWEARDPRTGGVIDRDVCVDSNGADNGYAACHLFAGGANFFTKICVKDFSAGTGYESCTGWEGWGYLD